MFGLAGETFAMPVAAVQETLRVSTITRVPHAPFPVSGIMNMRGRVVPVVNLRVRLGLPAAEIDSSSRILITSSHGRLMGLLVDSAQQVVRIDMNAVEAPPPDVMTAQSEYIVGVYRHMETLLILLDVERALSIPDSLQPVGA
jgi:purine-binding chemotaxis protein CheW